MRRVWIGERGGLVSKCEVRNAGRRVEEDMVALCRAAGWLEISQDRRVYTRSEGLEIEQSKVSMKQQCSIQRII